MTPEEVNKLNEKNKSKRKAPSRVTQYCYTCKRAREVEFGVIHCPICKSPLGQFDFVPSPKVPDKPVPKCPTCGSTHIRKISDLRRGAHALAWGILSNTARSQYECLDCSYKW